MKRFQLGFSHQEPLSDGHQLFVEPVPVALALLKLLFCLSFLALQVFYFQSELLNLEDNKEKTTKRKFIDVPSGSLQMARKLKPVGSLPVETALTSI